ncbi:unnamed protein product [Linum trigynum]|uniref:Uncharacterized protein n=1 Tax=Linum trigynum TaxID=586398 RepID=A0AAV2E9K5_9ROSI
MDRCWGMDGADCRANGCGAMHGCGGTQGRNIKGFKLEKKGSMSTHPLYVFLEEGGGRFSSINEGRNSGGYGVRRRKIVAFVVAFAFVDGNQGGFDEDDKE